MNDLGSGSGLRLMFLDVVSAEARLQLPLDARRLVTKGRIGHTHSVAVIALISLHADYLIRYLNN